MGVTCDVADEAQAVAMVERTVATYGRLDMAFNNAGIVGFTGDLADESAESFDREPPSTCANLDVHETRAAPDAHPGQRRHRQLSSLGGLVGQAGRATYHATKHGVIGLTKSAADGLCATRHPHQRRLPGLDRYTHGSDMHRKPARRDER